jgi:regulator of replication initiation timing
LLIIEKIIEELSAGASEEMEPLHERIEVLEEENGELKVEIEKLRNKQAANAV